METFKYDLQNYEIASNTWDRLAISNTSLSDTEFSLASTSANADQEPISGTGLAVTFYITYPNIERIPVSSPGEQISTYKYVFVNEIRIDSGFRNLSNVLSGSILVSSLTQPNTNSQYLSNYSYSAPKEGERITVSYNYDRLMADLTAAIETVRPIGGDVLVRKKDSIDVYTDLEITSTPQFSGSTSILQGSVQQRVNEFINSQVSGAYIDASDIINAVYSVGGVDRVVLTKFNTENAYAIKKTIVGKDDKYFISKSVVVSVTGR
jgi:hypothetical protein